MCTVLAFEVLCIVNQMIYKWNVWQRNHTGDLLQAMNSGDCFASNVLITAPAGLTIVTILVGLAVSRCTQVWDLHFRDFTIQYTAYEKLVKYATIMGTCRATCLGSICSTNTESSLLTVLVSVHSLVILLSAAIVLFDFDKVTSGNCINRLMPSIFCYDRGCQQDTTSQLMAMNKIWLSWLVLGRSYAARLLRLDNTASAHMQPKLSWILYRTQNGKPLQPESTILSNEVDIFTPMRIIFTPVRILSSDRRWQYILKRYSQQVYLSVGHEQEYSMAKAWNQMLLVVARMSVHQLGSSSLFPCTYLCAWHWNPQVMLYSAV